MIAEDYSFQGEPPNVSVSHAELIALISELIKQTIPNFKTYITSTFHKKTNLNEDELTQIFTKQAQILIRLKNYPFNVEGQYQDIYNLSKGYSDFFFYPNELNISTSSIFSVESKRLPSPEKKREKEYVIGEKNNGGIERYKTEKHGKELNECGLLGFIETETPSYWRNTINLWINELSTTNKEWSISEMLSEITIAKSHSYLHSIANRSTTQIELHHFWIVL